MNHIMYTILVTLQGGLVILQIKKIVDLALTAFLENLTLASC